MTQFRPALFLAAILATYAGLALAAIPLSSIAAIA